MDQLQNWMRYYPREQLLILRSEDLYSDPQTVVKQTLEFLGVKNGELNKEYRNYRRPSKKGYRKKVTPPKIDPAMRKRLIEHFEPHNARLYDFLDTNLDWDK